jgi:PAS domain S-box-containing protein
MRRSNPDTPPDAKMNCAPDDVSTPDICGDVPEFLSGGGELGKLMRAKDWSSTPLGPPETWPQSLRTSVSTCLNCSFPILIWWGPELVKIYNDAYAEIIAEKHPWALGSPGREVWPEIWDTIGPMLSRVVEAGEAFPANDLRLDLQRKGYPEECYFSFSYSPIRDESGRVAGVFCPVIENTDRVFAERRSALLLDLEARLRDLSDPETAKAVVSELLGNHLGVAQAAYAEVQDDNDHVLIEAAWDNGRVTSVSGLHRLDEFGPELIADLRRDVVVSVEDVECDERTSSPKSLSSFAGLQLRSFIDVPLFKAGRLVAFLFTGDGVARRWTDNEIALLRDIAERTWSTVDRPRAEAERLRIVEELRLANVSARQLAAIVTSSSDAIVSKTLDGTITSWNSAAERLFGYTAEEMLDHSILRLIPPERHREEEDILARIAAGEIVQGFETTRTRKGGQPVEVSVTVSPVFDGDGNIRGASKIARDITERRQAEEKLRLAEEKQGLLLKELDHRVKNLFSIVSGIVALSARTATTPRGLADAIQGRLGALASAHQLVRVREVGSTDHRETTLDELVRTVLVPYAAAAETGEAARFVVEGPQVAISGNAMTSFALVFHELATNAAKYGAFSARGGQVAIEWSREGGELHIVWREQGGPPVKAAPEREGFGSLLARRSVQGQLGGELAYEWDPDGLIVRLSAPSERLGA